MVQQMFPQADENYLKDRLGPSPSLDDVRILAEEMASGNYVSKSQTQQQETVLNHPHEHHPEQGIPPLTAGIPPPAADDKPAKRGKTGLKKSLGRAFGHLRGGGGGGGPTFTGGSTAPQQGPATTVDERKTGPVSPQHDAASYASMCDMLRSAAGQSKAVDSKGLSSSDTVLTSVPEDLDRGATCEVVPGQSLKPFPGPRGDGRTHNGIQVFSARNSPESEPFLLNHEDAVEKFSLVLKRLAGVYGVDPRAIAIFHDSRGGTIAFNANSALHFNIRFFHALHYLQNKNDSYDCYSYWMVVFAHELAHNQASGHNKEHGFYTESYISMYLPKFIALCGSLPKSF
jgi:hypothetical protein